MLSDPNDVAYVKLPAPAQLLFSVHPHLLGAEERLDLGAALEHPGELQ
jgi:hypothetical protein